MLRGLVWTLRQKRYATLALLMAVLAVFCVAAGTFEIHRLQEKRSDNARLTANARSAAVALTPALVPLTGSGRPVGPLAVRYRTVTATGRYDAAAQVYVGNQSQGGQPGFWVLTPLRSDSGTLLVARGFVAATAAGMVPRSVARPPAGSLRVTGWLQTGTGSATRIGDEVSAIDPQQQAQRLGVPVYQAYLTLNARQPGTAGLGVLPGPPQSDPTGGASEWQLLSYVVQWYVFAVLALAAPFLFARNEIRAARRRFLGLDADAEGSDVAGRPARIAALDVPAGGTGGTDLVIRPGATVARLSDVDARVRRRAVRLSDRYGLSLGPDVDPAEMATADGALDRPAEPAQPRHVIRGVPDGPDRSPGGPARTSSGLPLSADAYHGSYNDYLWQLALADGELSDLGSPRVRTTDGVPADSQQDEHDG